MLVSLAYDSDDTPSVERLSNPRNKLLIFQQPQMTALAGMYIAFIVCGIKSTCRAGARHTQH